MCDRNSNLEVNLSWNVFLCYDNTQLQETHITKPQNSKVICITHLDLCLLILSHVKVSLVFAYIKKKGIENFNILR